MVEEINHIEQELTHTDDPQTLASFLTRLAAYTSNYTEQYKQIQLVKPQKWLDIKNQKNNNEGWYMDNGIKKIPPQKPFSDKLTDMHWMTTSEGQKEIELESILARIKILYQSINRRLYSLETEYRMSRSL